LSIKWSVYPDRIIINLFFKHLFCCLIGLDWTGIIYGVILLSNLCICSTMKSVTTGFQMREIRTFRRYRSLFLKEDPLPFQRGSPLSIGVMLSLLVNTLCQIIILLHFPPTFRRGRVLAAILWICELPQSIDNQFQKQHIVDYQTIDIYGTKNPFHNAQLF